MLETVRIARLGYAVLALVTGALGSRLALPVFARVAERTATKRESGNAKKDAAENAES